MFLLLSAQSAVIDARPYPTVKPGPVLQSPDWSDYHIYPKSAARNDHEGRVRAETLIGTDGIPKACRITQSSSFSDLDDGTCALMMQMRFVPARNAAGATIESRYSGLINWRLTDALPLASATFKLSARTHGGRVVECRPLSAEGPYTRLWATNGCSYLADLGYYLGAHASEDASVTVEYRLDAGDGAPMLQAPWRSDVPIGHEKIAFSVTPGGDPSNCVPLEIAGFGRRGIRTLSPCGPMLAILYFTPLPKGPPLPPRHGTFETRVYLDKSSD